MERQTTYGNGTPQIAEFNGTKDWIEIEWDCDRQTTLPDCKPPQKPRTKPIEHAPDDGTPAGYQSPAQWDGVHPLNSQLVQLVSRIDYVTANEDMAQEMLLSLLQRSHTVRNAGDWRNAIRYAILDARRRAAQISRSGESLESLEYDPHRDRRKEQLPGPIKPYDGQEPPVGQILPTIPQHIVRAKVLSADQTIGEYRFNRQFQNVAYVMPD